MTWKLVGDSQIRARRGQGRSWQRRQQRDSHDRQRSADRDSAPRSYWLYVVDQCADGNGRFFGAYEDPATLFSTDMTGDAIFRVPGSSLKNAPEKQS